MPLNVPIVLRSCAMDTYFDRRNSNLLFKEMILTRHRGKGHPSQKVWDEWSILVNNNLQNFSPQDDYDSINDKLHDILIKSGMMYIGYRCIINTTSQIAEHLGIAPDCH